MNDREKTGNLPEEINRMIAEGQALAEETRSRVKKGGVDLIGRMQLRDDCAAVDRAIKKVQKGKSKPKDMDELRLAIIRLKTTSTEILK